MENARSQKDLEARIEELRIESRKLRQESSQLCALLKRLVDKSKQLRKQRPSYQQTSLNSPQSFW